MSVDNPITNKQICQEPKETIDDILSFLGTKTEPLPEGDEPDGPKFECGSIFKLYYDKHTGRKRFFPMTCGRFRECKTCHDNRKDGFQKRVLTALSKTKVAAIKLMDGKKPNPKAKELVKLLDKADYLRLPSEDDGALLFTATEEALEVAGAEAQLLSDYDGALPDDFNWDDLTNTPEHQRPSGNLGKEEDEEEDEDGDQEIVEIQVTQLTVPSEHKDLFAIAMDMAIFETRHFDPHTAEEVETALEQRTDVLVSVLDGMDVKIMFRNSRTEKLKISHISWQQSVTKDSPHDYKNPESHHIKDKKRPT